MTPLQIGTFHEMYELSNEYLESEDALTNLSSPQKAKAVYPLPMKTEINWLALTPVERHTNLKHFITGSKTLQVLPAFRKIKIGAILESTSHRHCCSFSRRASVRSTSAPWS